MLALLAFFALFCLIFVLVGVLVPDKDTGALAVQNGFLALGPLVGSLGAMAMIWLRNRVRPAKVALALAATFWMIGATLVGLGVFTAFSAGRQIGSDESGLQCCPVPDPRRGPVAVGIG